MKEITYIINDQEWTLPRPEVVAPEHNTPVWWVDSANQVRTTIWGDSRMDRARLEMGLVHISESRAQAWADFWAAVPER
jgi:hypothetical protein